MVKRVYKNATIFVSFFLLHSRNTQCTKSFACLCVCEYVCFNFSQKRSKILWAHLGIPKILVHTGSQCFFLVFNMRHVFIYMCSQKKRERRKNANTCLHIAWHVIYVNIQYICNTDNTRIIYIKWAYVLQISRVEIFVFFFAFVHFFKAKNRSFPVKSAENLIRSCINPFVLDACFIWFYFFRNETVRRKKLKKFRNFNLNFVLFFLASMMVHG